MYNNGQLLKINDVSRYVTISRAQIYRLMKAGRFPKSHRLSVKRVAWDYDDIVYLVAAGRLRTFRLSPSKRLYYYVDSAEAILDGRESARQTEPASSR